ncbi:MAG: DUF5615 family PIN-like protein [Chitinophagales bacterium]
MKLLLDQNLSYKLVNRLVILFPDSSHVRLEGMEAEEDTMIWTFAETNDFTVVTQDADFVDIGILKGYPPKVIWLRCGNTSTINIQNILTENYDTIKDFVENQDKSCLELF